MAAASSLLEQQTKPIICPACGGENPHDAIFCGCGKALGDFKYVLEELRAETKWYESLADRVTHFIGQPHFIAVHVVWFVLWVLLNIGIFAFVGTFDAYPFSLLGILLAIEAIFITGFLLISDTREDAHASKLAELDYEVNVRTFRKLQEIDNKLQAIMDKLDAHPK